MGGKGTRLRKLFPNTPKALIPIEDRELIFHQLDFLQHTGIRNVILATGYKGSEIYKAVGTYYKNLTISYSHETTTLGTAGALRLAINKSTSKEYVVLNGDCLYDIDLATVAKRWNHLMLLQNMLERQNKGLVVCTYKEDTSRYGTIYRDAYSSLVRFEEKLPNTAQSGYVNAGIYILKRNLIKTIPTNKQLSLEKDILPTWAKQHILYSYLAQGDFTDIGIPEAYIKHTQVIYQYAN